MIKVDVRMIAATNRDLAAMVGETRSAFPRADRPQTRQAD
jgi:transcriptional regulator with GAF, ATPase, and Fis domain